MPSACVAPAAGLSTILFTGPGDGLVIENTRQDQPVQISDLSLTTTRQEPGTALSVTFTGLDLNHYGEYPLGSIRELSIGGRDFGSSGWARGIHVQDFANAVIAENDVIGRRDIALATQASFQHMTMGIEVTGAGPIDVTTLHLTRNKVFSAATCMQDDGAIEGVEYLSNVVFGCGTGFVTTRSRQRPYVRYQGNHANVFTAGIAISNAPQSWVSDNLIYKNEHATGPTQAIALEASPLTQIVGNQMINQASDAVVSGDWYGIRVSNSPYVQADANVCERPSTCFHVTGSSTGVSSRHTETLGDYLHARQPVEYIDDTGLAGNYRSDGPVTVASVSNDAAFHTTAARTAVPSVAYKVPHVEAGQSYQIAVSIMSCAGGGRRGGGGWTGADRRDGESSVRRQQPGVRLPALAVRRPARRLPRLCMSSRLARWIWACRW